MAHTRKSKPVSDLARRQRSGAPGIAQRISDRGINPFTGKRVRESSIKPTLAQPSEASVKRTIRKALGKPNR